MKTVGSALLKRPNEGLDSMRVEMPFLLLRRGVFALSLASIDTRLSAGCRCSAGKGLDFLFAHEELSMLYHLLIGSLRPA